MVADGIALVGAAQARHARLGDVPVHILQALNDEVIPASSTRRLVHDLPAPPLTWDRVAAGHNTILRSDAFCDALRF